MADLKRLAALPGGAPMSASELVCASCNRPLAGGLTFTATGGVDDGAALFCESCRCTHLGPPCRGCGLPAPRADALVALDAHWHRACLKCAEPGCGAALGETYFEWAGEPRCHAHYVQHAAPRCEGCGEAVDGGLRALGRVWHDGCLRCEVSGAVLREGTFYVHEGRTIAKEARAETAPLCAACGEPALEGRLFAMGKARRRNSAPCSILLRAQLGHGPPPRTRRRACRGAVLLPALGRVRLQTDVRAPDHHCDVVHEDGVLWLPDQPKVEGGHGAPEKKRAHDHAG